MIDKLNERVDQEWVKLMLEALEIGLSIDEVKAFFLENSINSGKDGKVPHEFFEKVDQ